MFIRHWGKRPSFRKLYCCLALWVAAFALSAQNCDEILKHGIYDTESQKSDIDRATSFANWYKRFQYRSLQEARSASINAVLPIDGILVDFGLKADEESYSNFKEMIDHFQQYSFSDREKFARVITRINGSVVSAWEHCTTQDGLHFWAIQQADPATIIICARFINPGDVPLPSVTDFTILPKSAYEPVPGCFINHHGGLIRNASIHGSTIKQLIRRKPSIRPGVAYDALTLAITSTQGQGLVYSLPEEPLPKPFIREFSASPSSVPPKGSATLKWDVIGADSVTIDPIGPVQSSDELRVSPAQTIQYRMVAHNKGGDTSRTTQLIVEDPKIVAAFVQFETTGNDKDRDTDVEVFLKDISHQEISYTKPSYGTKYDNNSNSGWLGLNLNRRTGVNTTKSALKNGIITIKIRANGNDKWKYHPKIRLIFSDGTDWESQWLGPDHDLESTGSHWTGDDDWTYVTPWP